MKNFQYLLFFFLAFSLSSCDENMPEIPCITCRTDVNNVDPDAKKVLVEKFTGVKCTNCPQASDLVEDLMAIYPGQVLEVSIHSGFFAKPYTESQYDFRTDDGNGLEQFLGAPVGYPSGTINRFPFETAGVIQIGEYNKWSGMVATELDKEPIINVKVENGLNTSGNTITSTVELTPVEDIDDNTNLYITVFVTESNITDYQLDGSFKNPNYVHKHVLREIVTDIGGNLIDRELLRGETVELTFTTNLSSDWNPDEIEILAAVHFNEPGSKYILQAGAGKLPQ